MATTTNYGWEKPTVGGDSGAWGTKLNATLDGIDTSLKSVSDVGAAALPKAGGAMTGRVDHHSGTMKRVDKGSVSGAQSFDLSAGNYFTITTTGNSTWSFTNVPSGSWATGFIVKVVNGGAFVITFPASVKWPSGTVPTLTVSGNDTLVFVTDDNGTTWRGAVLMKDSR